MSKSVRWLAVLSMFVLGLSLSACELEEECDPETDENCVVDAGTDVVEDQGPQYQSFYYVLVEDKDAPTSWPGCVARFVATPRVAMSTQ